MSKIKYISFFKKDAVYDSERIVGELLDVCEQIDLGEGGTMCTIQAVQGELVHCKDCKYFSQNDRWCKRYECDDGDRLICWDLGEDGFCSRGEKR